MGNQQRERSSTTFKKEQDLMSSLVEQSILPTLRLDISDNRIDAAVEAIADWMVDTGGIWADY